MRRCLLVSSLIVILAAVAGYNYWAYCCGRCSIQTFVTLGPFGTALIGVNAVAALVLVGFKLCRNRKQARRRCRCGASAPSDWAYCPWCGSPRVAETR